MLAAATAAALPWRAGAQTSATSIFEFLPPGEAAAIRAGTSRLDCAPAIIKACTQAPGAIHFPAGRYRIATPVRYTPDRFADPFGRGPVLLGDGIRRTVLVNDVMRGAALDFDAGVTRATGYRAIAGLRIEDMTIDGFNAADGAIRLRTVMQASLVRLHIIGHRGTGLRIPCSAGDSDGSNMVALRQVRIENCGGWGVDSLADPGSNENSFLSFDHVFIQNCGTRSSAADPPSGGMRHKGQIMTLRQCAFTLNQNVGLFLPGAAGLGNSVSIEDTAFENNLGRHLYCTGYDGVRARGIQLYNSDNFRASVGCEFLGDRYPVRGIDFDGVIVRASARNAPYTAFRFGGANLDRKSIRIDDVVWQDWGYQGQVKAEGMGVL